MSNQVDTHIYNELGEKVGDLLSPIYFGEDFGYLREIAAIDNLSEEDKNLNFGYFDSTGELIFAADTKELIFSEARSYRWLVFLTN